MLLSIVIIHYPCDFQLFPLKSGATNLNPYRYQIRSFAPVKRLLSTIFSAIITAVFILTACSSGAQTPQINPTEGAQMLAGVYTTTITAEDVSKMESLDPTLPSSQGDWQITLTNDGKFESQLNGAFAAKGLFSVENNEISFYPTQVCEDCGCIHNIWRFTWAQKDNRLAFAYTAGTCDTMKLVLTSRPIIRQP
jgi:hypothetical protein